MFVQKRPHVVPEWDFQELFPRHPLHHRRRPAAAAAHGSHPIAKAETGLGCLQKCQSWCAQTTHFFVFVLGVAVGDFHQTPHLNYSAYTVVFRDVHKGSYG